MLAIRDLSKSFNVGTPFELSIFQGLDLDIEDRTSTALIGPNGCGKSTLLNLIAGSLQPDDGTLSIDDEDITHLSEDQRSKYVGRVHQNPSMGVAPSLTILENLAIADKKNCGFGWRRLINKNRKEYYKEILSTLDLGLENMLNTYVKQLSGGQRQSLSLLMAAMKHPDILLLDEHTAALDPKTSKVVMNKTVDLIEKNNMTTVMITHNMEDAVEYSDRVIMLDQGKIILDTPSKDITAEALHEIYRDKLLRMGVSSGEKVKIA